MVSLTVRGHNKMDTPEYSEYSSDTPKIHPICIRPGYIQDAPQTRPTRPLTSATHSPSVSVVYSELPRVYLGCIFECIWYLSEVYTTDTWINSTTHAISLNKLEYARKWFKMPYLGCIWSDYPVKGLLSTGLLRLVYYIKLNYFICHLPSLYGT